MHSPLVNVVKDEAIYEEVSNEMSEKKKKVKLNRRQHVMGDWKSEGDTVELYEREADAMIDRGVAEDASGRSSKSSKSED